MPASTLALAPTPVLSPVLSLGPDPDPAAGPTGAAGPGEALLVPDTDPGAPVRFAADADVDATIFGPKWAMADLTFSFPTDAAAYGGAAYGAGEAAPAAFEPMNAAQAAAVRHALSLVSLYTPLRFTEIAETATGIGAAHATLRFAQTSAASVASALANLPGVTAAAGDVWLGRTGQPFFDAPAPGNWGFAAILHEIGHALGLKHGHQDYRSLDLTSLGGVNYFAGLLPAGSHRPGTGALGPARDGQSWSLMTYNLAPGFAGFGGDGANQPQTYQMLDIAALQVLYGANYAANAGDTVYRFTPGSGEMVVDGVGQGAPSANKILRTIWDGGGTDRIDLSAYQTGLVLDLRPGSFSTLSAAQLADHNALNGGGAPAMGNIALARLVGGDPRGLIEDAGGGAGDDLLTGNDAGNRLGGGAGQDRLYGGAGNDVLEGGSGNDSLYGGEGDDILRPGPATPGATPGEACYGGAGLDLLDLSGLGARAVVNLAAATWSLGVAEAIESVTGSALDDRLTGDAGANTLSGGAGDDRLTGGGGADRLDGGAGRDVASYARSGEAVRVRLGSGAGHGGDAEGDRLAGIETLIGSRHGDRLVGAPNASDALFGRPGADLLKGLSGDDRLAGQAGRDILKGGAGADLFLFGAGYGKDRVRDFEDGIDHVDLLGPLGFDDLALSAIRHGVRAALAEAPATFLDLIGVHLGEIGPGDFV